MAPSLSRCRASVAAVEASAMTTTSTASNGSASLVLRGVDVAVLGKVLNQQKQEGRAAVQMIAAAGEVAAPKGAPEPGKGTLVDVVA